jgi:hypothetical protein
MIKTTEYTGGRVRYYPKASEWEDTSNLHWTDHCPHRITGSGFFTHKKTSSIREDKQYNLSMAEASAMTGIECVALRKLMNRIMGKAQYNITKGLLVKVSALRKADIAGQQSTSEPAPLPGKPVPTTRDRSA